MVTAQLSRVLLAEDEFLIAEDMARELEESGLEVIGPHASVSAALAAVRSDQPIDAAVLDINLRGEASFPVADALMARGVPVVFTTGYDREEVPGRYAAAELCAKPLVRGQVKRALERAIGCRTR